MPALRRRALALALGAAGWLAAGTADAYCRTAVCNGDTAGQLCEPPGFNDCGVPLRWKQPCVGYSLHSGASRQVSFLAATNLVAQAFAAWESADCEGTPAIHAVDIGPVSCGAREYNQADGGGNSNLILFHDDAWPYANTVNTLALTTVTFDLDSGEIFDADLEVNGTIDLTTSDSKVTYDLLSILTHEVGHFLGFAHSSEVAATMFAEYLPGNTDLRTLDPDDAAAMCAAYPPGSLEGACQPTPRHGFKQNCGAAPPPPADACTFGAPLRSGSGILWTAAAALAGALARRRRACRRS